MELRIDGKCMISCTKQFRELFRNKGLHPFLICKKLLLKGNSIWNSLRNLFVSRHLSLNKLTPNTLLISAGNQAYSRLNKLLSNRMAEIQKCVQKYNCLPKCPELPEKLNVKEVSNLEHNVWATLLAFYENLDLDPLDPIKISAVRQLGLLRSAEMEKYT